MRRKKSISTKKEAPGFFLSIFYLTCKSLHSHSCLKVRGRGLCHNQHWCLSCHIRHSIEAIRWGKVESNCRYHNRHNLCSYHLGYSLQKSSYVPPKNFHMYCAFAHYHFIKKCKKCENISMILWKICWKAFKNKEKFVKGCKEKCWK